MFSEICQSASQLDRSLAQKNVSVDSGCTSLHLESIKIQETSSNHLKAITIVTTLRKNEYGSLVYWPNNIHEKITRF